MIARRKELIELIKMFWGLVLIIALAYTCIFVKGDGDIPLIPRVFGEGTFIGFIFMLGVTAIAASLGRSRRDAIRAKQEVN